MTVPTHLSAEEATAYEALTVALEEACGERLTRTAGYWAYGFTAAGVRTLWALAERAVRHDTPVTREITGVATAPPGVDVRAVYNHLKSDVYDTAADYGADTFPHLLSWAALRAGTIDADAAKAQCRLWERRAPAAHAEFRRWLAMGEHGALMYAGGLTLNEAEEQTSGGTVDVAGLTLLMALRGSTLPEALGTAAHLMTEQ